MGKELFDNIPSKVADLLSNIKNERIGLPDLQRHLVWKDNKVRELLDSMMKGYPIGYIMLWTSPDDYENTGYIGKNDKMYKRPDSENYAKVDFYVYNYRFLYGFYRIRS